MATQIQFATKSTADSFREDYADHLCSDDDRRRKTVTFASDTPEHVLDEAEAAATSEQADQEHSITAADLTDQDTRALDFSRDGVNVPLARYMKGLAAEYDVDPWQHVDLAEIDHAEDARPIFERASQTGGIAQGGGAEYDDEATERRDRQRRQNAEKHVSGQCDHAEGHCRHGDPEACAFLQDACGFSEDEIDAILAEPDTDTTDDDEITGQAAGALKRAWQGYKGALPTLDDALADIRAEWDHAQQAARAINRVREAHGQPPLHFDRLEEQQAQFLDLARKMASDCEECHADHDDHDHAVSEGDVEELPAAVAEGTAETTVGTSDATDDYERDRKEVLGKYE